MLWMRIFLKILFYPTIFFTLGMNKFTFQKKMAGEVRVGAMDGYISTPTLQMQIFIHINSEIYSYYKSIPINQRNALFSLPKFL